jgi:glycosyltransferase involved in cell wall biosynthesis
MTDTTVEVSVVIPCLNEAQPIAFCVDKALAGFTAGGIAGEVVVADNGSTDGSQQIATQYGARVVPAACHALRAGIEAARGQFIIMGDADDSYDFSEVRRCWRCCVRRVREILPSHVRTGSE